MDAVHFLNLGYIITRAYDFVAGIQFDPNVIPAWVGGVVHVILILGMVISFILLILVVYAQIRMVQVEHEGFHALEEEEHEAQAHGPEGETHASTRWDDIVALASSGNESEWRRAIMEADIMLGDALSAAGYEGVSVGEQLKVTNPLQVTTLRIAWEAHMVRNRIAHDGAAFELTERDVRAAIDQYRRVFEELGVI